MRTERYGDAGTRRHGDTGTRQTHSPRLRVAASPRHVVLLFVCLLSAGINSAFAIDDKAGTSAGSFLKIPTDARGVVLGGVMAAMAEGTEGMRWNPAALGRLDTEELAATHVEYYQDVAIENISYAHPLDESAIGVNLFYLGAGDLDGRDDFGNPTGDFKFYDLVGSVGYGRHLRATEKGLDIYVGGELKLVQEKIADTQYQNPALDAGILLIPSENLRGGFTVRNLSAGKADFPKELTAAGAYTFMRVFTGGVAATYADDAPIRYGVAGEYRFPELQNTVVRAGYRTHDDLDDSLDSKISAFRNASLAGVTLGGGFEYRPLMFKTLRLQVDYGMAPFGALGISHTFTIKAKW
jgi:hypothetical protein